MPTVSVSAIGLVAAIVVALVRRTVPVRRLLAALLGAWAGFALGATAGVIVDVVAGTGAALVYCGHAAAAVTAVAAALVLPERMTAHPDERR